MSKGPPIVAVEPHLYSAFSTLSPPWCPWVPSQLSPSPARMHTSAFCFLIEIQSHCCLVRWYLYKKFEKVCREGMTTLRTAVAFQYFPKSTPHPSSVVLSLHQFHQTSLSSFSNYFKNVSTRSYLCSTMGYKAKNNLSLSLGPNPKMQFEPLLYVCMCIPSL